MNDLSDRIRLLRKSQRMSQTQLAERVGISQEYLSELERALKKPSVPVLEKLCDALGCSADFLLGLETTKASDKMKESYTRGSLSSEMLDEMMRTGVNDDELRLALKLARVMRTQNDT